MNASQLYRQTWEVTSKDLKKEISQTITPHLVFLMERLVTECTLANLKQHYMWTAQISKTPEVWLSWTVMQV